MLITTMPKQALKFLKNLTYIRGSSRSAYNLETVEKSAQYLLKAFTHLSDFDKRQPAYEITQEHKLTIHNVLTSMLSSPISGNEALCNQIELKIFAITSMLKLLKEGKLTFKDEDEIDLYVEILNPLNALGINEINSLILQFYEFIATHSDRLLADYFLKAVETLLTVHPVIAGSESPQNISDQDRLLIK